jgi:hypothetical protein
MLARAIRIRCMVSHQKLKSGYAADGYPSSVLFMEAMEQLSRRLSIFGALLTGTTKHLKRSLSIFSVPSV